MHWTQYWTYLLYFSYLGIFSYLHENHREQWFAKFEMKWNERGTVD